MPMIHDLSKVVLEAAEKRAEALIQQIGETWAAEAQMRNPAPRFGPIHYEDDGLHVPLIAYILSEGAKPHVITARNAPYLHFYWERRAKWIVTRSVNHPGYDGTRYLSVAWKETQRKVWGAMMVRW